VKLEPRVDVRFKDIGRALFRVSPRIVHFSGHGSRDGRLYLLDESGLPSLARPEGLADLFTVAAKDLECVVVSACYSEQLAEAVVEHVDYAVGMRGEVADETAIMFSVGFYQGLAAGRSVQEAFDVGRAYVRGQSRDPREYEQLLLFGRH
jgi:CHAT domain